MYKKKICFIAQFPPPIHGLSKAVDTLYNSELQNEFSFEKIDITNNKKFLKNLMAISKSKADLFYFTISQTKGGNLRDLVLFKLLRMQNKKCLVHLHGGYYRKLVDHNISNWQKKANYRAIKKLDGAIVLGKSLKPIFQGMVPDEKIFVVPNCVDDEYLMSDDEFKEKIQTVETRTVRRVLYLSNFIRSKGYPEVLEMAKQEKEQIKNIGDKKLHFDFAGKFFEESDKQFFFNYIKENGLEGYITYHGVVGGDKKRELLKSCDIFTLLTRYPNEGQPISILEAMGNGMLIVTTDHAGIPDIVKDGMNGIVVGKKIDLKRLVERLSTFEVTEIQKIAVYNRKKVKEEYNESRYIRDMRTCFLKILEDR